ncbi:mitogen-activated protein kinase kinase kinase 4 isoform X2 [Toxorhynchites rutilus septentrionalis]|uniref:mitogen-activated protein kinase kinase kinase 4 isoform X2 n=1 Tax=Toxorhynchites rutilus septentrionalis TaxID=329112 RepID=UPI00247AB03B|nr:mitogen-activated protein kinase kinase kinase 4 isoform X2 [Toxorhynchites rutilus septentrionalis]
MFARSTIVVRPEDETDFVCDADCNFSQEFEEGLRISSVDEVLSQYAEQYGSTPPRTRIKNKSRSSRQRMEGSVKMRTGGRLARPRADRRNTVDCAILNQMIMEPNGSEEKARTDKRSTQLLRESEREIKMAAAASTMVARNSTNFGHSGGPIEERAESMPITNVLPSMSVGVVPALIESCNRFMSVKSRPVGCRTSAPPLAFASFRESSANIGAAIPENRIAFHETFSNLIKLGSIDKDRTNRSVISTEERLWQTHVNDLIWLELQAWHADRSVDQQDKILCQARNEINSLLKEIMDFRFQRQFARTASDVSMADSGLGTDATSSTASSNRQFCFGCLSMYCKDCLDIQTIALKQVENLLLRLESKEALFPSSKAMGMAFPLYLSEEFVGRVKAMCLWYNMTKQHRLTLLILGKLLARLQGNKRDVYHWPIMETDSSTSSSVQEENGDSGDSGQCDLSSSSVGSCPAKRVQFVENGSATESANSDESGRDFSDFEDLSVRRHFSFTGDAEMSQYMNTLNFYSVNSTTEASSYSTNDSTTLYRKYIENVLKCRGLGKSLTFLHRLHNVVLRKAQLTLEKHNIQEQDDHLFDEEDVPCIEPPLDKEQESELRRFGAWSNEAKQLNLPSYVSAFIFLSLIPLEVIQEFLRMRLETRPIQPNPLSLEQLIKELKEGLTLAMIHRERFQKHINTALGDRETELDKYMAVLEAFDGTVKNIFGLYLEYAEQWILVATPDCHQKAALDEEWRFTKLLSPMIPGQHAMAANRFCMIVEKVLENTGRKMIARLRELEDQIKLIDRSDSDKWGKKWQFLALCRETQYVFTFARDITMKIMAFTKGLFRDLEKRDFHRDHCDDSEEEAEPGVVLRNIGKTSSPVCQEVVDSLRVLKKNALLFRNKLTSVIENLQDECHVRNMADMDEGDRIAVLSRTREILHQGYKFGFELHKDLTRLYETKADNCRDRESELKLSNAVVHFAKLWMKFVMERCERGRGLRPRWANQGLEFLISACDPQCTSHLNNTEFEDLKSKMDACISHVIGSIREPETLRRSPRSRKSSPSPSPSQGRASIPTITLSKTFQNQLSLREDGVTLRPHNLVDANDIYRKQTSCDDGLQEVKIRVPTEPRFGSKPLRQLRVRDAINKLDIELDEKLRERNLIGNMKEISYCDKALHRARSVNFSWHRGIKIGQGRFGKVYTAVNNSSGELMAMKEIAIQPGETSAIRKVAEELKIFEGINHRNLVKYHGVEIHREELLIFMELCPEGTLESLVEMNGGLPEAQTRRYTIQLLSGVKELHRHGVVHRDIKTANIFLTRDGNSLKLGDFGSAVKIQAHTTMPGELKGYVGTQAYMAPEVFTKTNSEGHGRAADIWSTGCVVIEICSGKRPWHQFDSNFQIMFKVGMGETPEIPSCLSEEGYDFVESCLQHDPKQRKTAEELLQHNFCKVNDESMACFSPLPVKM